MAALANQSTFSFKGTAYTVTSVSVEGPTPEIVNMTGLTDPIGSMRMLKTGDFTSPGRISVEGFGFNDPLPLLQDKLPGAVTFQTPSGVITRNCILDSASVQARVGDVFRVSMTFMPTDQLT